MAIVVDQTPNAAKSSASLFSQVESPESPKLFGQAESPDSPTVDYSSIRSKVSVYILL